MMNAAQASLFLSRASLSLLDEDDRPLGEHAVEGAYERAGVDERRCPYEDRRARVDKPMNIAALRQISRCWPDVITQLEHLAHKLAVEGGDGEPRALSGHLVWRVHLLAIAAPALFRLEHPTHRIPRTLSSLFKSSLGYASVIPSLLMSRSGVADTPLGEVLSERDFFDLSDKQGWLIGQTQVCAGSRAFIERSYLAMTRPIEHEEARASIYEREDLSEISMALALTWAKLLECAIYTRELLASGDRAKLRGYDASRSMYHTKEAWPVCVQLYRSPNAPRYFALPRAMPGLHPSHLTRLFHRGDWSMSPYPDDLVEVDTRMRDICLTFAKHFGAETDYIDVSQCLIPESNT